MVQIGKKIHHYIEWTICGESIYLDNIDTAVAISGLVSTQYNRDSISSRYGLEVGGDFMMLILRQIKTFAGHEITDSDFGTIRYAGWDGGPIQARGCQWFGRRWNRVRDQLGEWLFLCVCNHMYVFMLCMYMRASM